MRLIRTVKTTKSKLPTDPIRSFSACFRYLSNFYIEPDGTHVEREYQAAKCADASQALLFANLNPADSKRLGQTITIRPDWDKVKVSIMLELVTKKFTDHPQLAALLRSTGDRRLIEGNYWGDTFWGMFNGHGSNHLGLILMRVRDELKDSTI